jgi:hypothetical protein
MREAVVELDKVTGRGNQNQPAKKTNMLIETANESALQTTNRLIEAAHELVTNMQKGLAALAWEKELQNKAEQIQQETQWTVDLNPKLAQLYEQFNAVVSFYSASQTSEYDGFSDKNLVKLIETAKALNNPALDNVANALFQAHQHVKKIQETTAAEQLEDNKKFAPELSKAALCEKLLELYKSYLSLYIATQTEESLKPVVAIVALAYQLSFHPTDEWRIPPSERWVNEYKNINEANSGHYYTMGLELRKIMNITYCAEAWRFADPKWATKWTTVESSFDAVQEVVSGKKDAKEVATLFNQWKGPQSARSDSQISRKDSTYESDSERTSQSERPSQSA